jgi:hypothetical protein
LSDSWDRPAADDEPANRRDAATVDVPLTGADDVPVEPSTDHPTERPTDRRRLVGIALAVGVTLGVAVTIVRSASDDGDADRPAPSTAGDPSTAITTPPTLRALVTLPPPDPEPRTGDATVVTFGAPAPTDPVTVPTYPPASDVTPREVIGYDIAAAVDRNDDDVARRSDTHIELGYAGYVLDVSIVRDPDNDRYLIEFESRGATEEVIVDVATGTTYVNPGTERETRLPTDDIIGPAGDAGVNDFFDRLLRGPLRSDTFNAAATRGRGVVEIDGVGEAREFVTSVDGELVPEWQIHAFGPVGEFAPSDRPSLLQYLVYVDGQGRLVQVDGVSMIGTVPQLVRHRMTVLDEPPGIELPGDATLSPEGTASTRPETTSDDAG